MNDAPCRFEAVVFDASDPSCEETRTVAAAIALPPGRLYFTVYRPFRNVRR